MKEQHILFVNMPALPLSKLTTRRGIRAFPFGILYLSAILKKQKHPGRIACVDYLVQDSGNFVADNLEKFIVSEAVNAVSPYAPDVLAFSFNVSTSYEFFCRCLPLLRKTWPRAAVVVGGMHASNAVEFLLKNYDIDYIIAGEGEETFPLLLSLLRQGEKPDINGVHSPDAIRYDKRGKPEIAAPIGDLDSLPFPDWSLLNMGCYTGQAAEGAQLFWDDIGEARGQHRHASLLTTRGCPFHCTYCASYSIHGRKIYVRDAQSVVEEMRQLNKSYGVNYFHIFDDSALFSEKRAIELLRAMKSSGIENLKAAFTQTLSVHFANEAIIDALVDYIGIRTISFAVETGDPHTQKRIKKNCDLIKAQRLIRYAQSKGLIVTINIILGFPEETREQMLRSISYAKEHLNPNWIQFHVATPIIGTEMYEQFIKAGCITDSPHAWNNMLSDYRYFDTPWITAEELNELRYRANLECNFADNHDLGCGDYKKALVLFKAVTRLYPFHIFAWDGIRRAQRISGNEEEVQTAGRKMREFIFNDPRSRELLEKYGDLFPEAVRICGSCGKQCARIDEGQVFK